MQGVARGASLPAAIHAVIRFQVTYGRLDCLAPAQPAPFDAAMNPARRCEGIAMNFEYLAIVLVVAAFIGLWLRDNAVRKRVARKSARWQCYRCQAPIAPGRGSRDVQIAGTDLDPINVRYCKSCADRERRIFWGTCAALLTAFLVVLLIGGKF